MGVIFIYFWANEVYSLQRIIQTLIGDDSRAGDS